jgi:hypothetical protein
MRWESNAWKSEQLLNPLFPSSIFFKVLFSKGRILFFAFWPCVLGQGTEWQEIFSIGHFLCWNLTKTIAKVAYVTEKIYVKLTLSKNTYVKLTYIRQVYLAWCELKGNKVNLNDGSEGRTFLCVNGLYAQQFRKMPVYGKLVSLFTHPFRSLLLQKNTKNWNDLNIIRQYFVSVHIFAAKSYAMIWMLMDSARDIFANTTHINFHNDSCRCQQALYL